MSNLLTQQEKQVVKREYRHRVLATTLALFFIAVVFAIGEMLPSYFLLEAEATILENRLTELRGVEEEGGDASGAALEEARLIVDAVQNEVYDTPYRTIVLREALSSRPDGVTVSELSFERTPDGEGVLVVSGLAATRADLTAYSGAIEENPRFTGVEVPVENLARTQNVPFSMRVTGEF